MAASLTKPRPMALMTCKSPFELFEFWTQWFIKEEREKNFWPKPFKNVLLSAHVKLLEFERLGLLGQSNHPDTSLIQGHVSLTVGENKNYKNKKPSQTTSSSSSLNSSTPRASTLPNLTQLTPLSHLNLDRIEALLFLVSIVPPEHYADTRLQQSLEKFVVEENIDNFHKIMRFLKKKNIVLAPSVYMRLLEEGIDFKHDLYPATSPQELKDNAAKRAQLLAVEELMWRQRAEKFLSLYQDYGTPILHPHFGASSTSSTTSSASTKTKSLSAARPVSFLKSPSLQSSPSPLFDCMAGAALDLFKYPPIAYLCNRIIYEAEPTFSQVLVNLATQFFTALPPETIDDFFSDIHTQKLHTNAHLAKKVKNIDWVFNWNTSIVDILKTTQQQKLLQLSVPHKMIDSNLSYSAAAPDTRVKLRVKI